VEKVRELRKKKGWAPEDLAREAGLTCLLSSAGRRKVVSLPAFSRQELRRLFKEAQINDEES